jgi:hypothetical protein
LKPDWKCEQHFTLSHHLKRIVMAGHRPGHSRFWTLGYQARESARSHSERRQQHPSTNFFFVSVF